MESFMRTHVKIGLSSLVALAAAATASAQQSYGNLSYPANGGTEIPFTWSGGDNDNTGFVYTNNQVNGSWLTVGMRASPYYTGDNGSPNSTGGTGNWGTVAGGMVNLGGGAVNGTDYSQGRWHLGYNFFPLNSQNTPGVGIPGLWNGLAFNPNTLGDNQFTIDIRQGQYGAVVGSTNMTVSVVPAPGAIALVGAVGLAGSRRRR
jgi:hypothetical protein